MFDSSKLTCKLPYDIVYYVGQLDKHYKNYDQPKLYIYVKYTGGGNK